MKVLGFDTETTGLDTSKDFIIEVGAVLFDVDENNNWQPGARFSTLVHEPSYPPLSDEIKKITGIASLEGALSFSATIETLEKMFYSSDCVVAHNKGYDKNILLSQLERFMLGIKFVTDRTWICSAEDLPSNKNFKSWKLSHLALDYGVAVNPKELHRAMDDVLLMGRMLNEAKANPHEMLMYSNAPYIVLQADIPGPWVDGGVGKSQAQALGYNWEKPKGSDRQYPKQWVKKIKDFELQDELAKAPFRTNNLGRL